MVLNICSFGKNNWVKVKAALFKRGVTSGWRFHLISCLLSTYYVPNPLLSWSLCSPERGGGTNKNIIQFQVVTRDMEEMKQGKWPGACFSTDPTQRGRQWTVRSSSNDLAGVSNLQPTMAMNAAQHKIVNLLKTLWDFFVFISVCVFNVWPWGAKSLDTPGTREFVILPVSIFTLPKLGYIPRWRLRAISLPQTAFQ